MQPILYLMMGYPGAGKTTTAKIIHELTDATYLSSDGLRIEMAEKPTFSKEEHENLYRMLNQKTEELLGSGQSVIYDANLNRYEHRKEKYDICQRTGAKPVLLWVKTDRPIAKERALSEDRARLVPQNETASDMFERIAKIIEEPHGEENPIIVDGTKVGKDYLKSLLLND